MMQENKLFESLLDAIPFAAYTVDIDSYEVIYANKLMRKTMYAPKEKACWKKIFGQEQICSWCTIVKLQERKEDKAESEKCSCEFFNESDDRWIKSHDELISLPDERDVKYSILVDISEQKAMQGSMIKSHALLAIKNKQILNTNQNLQITKLKLQKSLNELEIQRQKAEDSTKTKSDFLANMSHEIRTPMNAIIGMTHLVKESSLDNKQLSYINKIESASHNLLNIINDILDFSKMEAGKLEIEKINFNINEMIQNTKSMVDIKAHGKNLAFTIINSSKDSVFYGDPLRIGQILINLLNNAIKFTAEGEIRLIVKKISDDVVRFSVRDTGIGISEEKQEKLFQPFSQADVSSTREYGGTGLGLSISKQLVELMGGKIWIESEVGIGSEFIFEIELPRGKGGSSKPIVQKNTSKEEIASLGGNCILLCEDNDVNQEIIFGLLENSGILIDIANNGKEAIEKFRANSYNLILMDIQMPIMDGYEATKIIRDSNKNIPIIALSANAMREDIEKTMSAGMNEHLNKPIDIDKLYKTLLKYLSKKRETGATSTVQQIQALPHVQQRSDKYSCGAKIEDEIPEFKTIDTVQGLHQMAGNKKLYLKILNDFLNNYREIHFEELSEEEFQRVTHTLKGLSANIGARALYEISKELDETQDKSLLSAWHVELNKVLKELNDALPKRKKEEILEHKEKFPHAKRAELFFKLKNAAATSRPRECEKVINEIDKYELSINDDTLLKKAKACMQMYEFKEASIILKGIE